MSAQVTSRASIPSSAPAPPPTTVPIQAGAGHVGQPHALAQRASVCFLRVVLLDPHDSGVEDGGLAARVRAVVQQQLPHRRQRQLQQPLPAPRVQPRRIQVPKLCLQRSRRRRQYRRVGGAVGAAGRQAAERHHSVPLQGRGGSERIGCSVHAALCPQPVRQAHHLQKMVRGSAGF